eukprot:snap_masked-scaffold_2-processed-gene-12.47-mRNA-1 protein AED:1.00 eAED:1.00 QI:0/-1/0/0/-1/1/1/0/1146
MKEKKKKNGKYRNKKRQSRHKQKIISDVKSDKFSVSFSSSQEFNATGSYVQCPVYSQENELGSGSLNFLQMRQNVEKQVKMQKITCLDSYMRFASPYKVIKAEQGSIKEIEQVKDIFEQEKTRINSKTLSFWIAWGILRHSLQNIISLNLSIPLHETEKSREGVSLSFQIKHVIFTKTDKWDSFNSEKRKILSLRASYLRFLESRFPLEDFQSVESLIRKVENSEKEMNLIYSLELAEKAKIFLKNLSLAETNLKELVKDWKELSKLRRDNNATTSEVKLVFKWKDISDTLLKKLEQVVYWLKENFQFAETGERLSRWMNRNVYNEKFLLDPVLLYGQEPSFYFQKVFLVEIEMENKIVFSMELKYFPDLQCLKPISERMDNTFFLLCLFKNTTLKVTLLQNIDLSGFHFFPKWKVISAGFVIIQDNLSENMLKVSLFADEQEVAEACFIVKNHSKDFNLMEKLEGVNFDTSITFCSNSRKKLLAASKENKVCGIEEISKNKALFLRDQIEHCLAFESKRIRLLKSRFQNSISCLQRIPLLEKQIEGDMFLRKYLLEGDSNLNNFLSERKETLHSSIGRYLLKQKLLFDEVLVKENIFSRKCLTDFRKSGSDFCELIAPQIPSLKNLLNLLSMGWFEFLTLFSTKRKLSPEQKNTLNKAKRKETASSIYIHKLSVGKIAAGGSFTLVVIYGEEEYNIESLPCEDENFVLFKKLLFFSPSPSSSLKFTLFRNIGKVKCLVGFREVKLSCIENGEKEIALGLGPIYLSCYGDSLYCDAFNLSLTSNMISWGSTANRDAGGCLELAEKISKLLSGVNLRCEPLTEHTTIFDIVLFVQGFVLYTDLYKEELKAGGPVTLFQRLKLFMSCGFGTEVELFIFCFLCILRVSEWNERRTQNAEFSVQPGNVYLGLLNDFSPCIFLRKFSYRSKVKNFYITRHIISSKFSDVTSVNKQLICLMKASQVFLVQNRKLGTIDDIQSRSAFENLFERFPTIDSKDNGRISWKVPMVDTTTKVRFEEELLHSIVKETESMRASLNLTTIFNSLWAAKLKLAIQTIIKKNNCKILGQDIDQNFVLQAIKNSLIISRTSKTQVHVFLVPLRYKAHLLKDILTESVIRSNENTVTFAVAVCPQVSLGSCVHFWVGIYSMIA